MANRARNKILKLKKKIACTVILPSESVLIKEILGVLFPSIVLQLSFDPIQSEQLYFDQSGQWLWTIQTVRIQNPHLHEDKPIKSQGQELLCSFEASSSQGAGSLLFLSTRE